MYADHVFKVVDLHSGGAPARLVLSGVPPLPGRTVIDQMHYFAEHYDWIRRALVLEPRGRGLTSAIVLLAPTRPDADVAAFFMEAHGYLPMCGSDTIATATALLQTGQVPRAGTTTTVRLDTPAGLVEATVDSSHGVDTVTFLSAPAFCALPRQHVTLPTYGPVTLDVSYGGNFYAIAEASQFGLALSQDTTGEATRVAAELHAAVNRTLPVQHPELPTVRGVTHVQLYEQPDTADAPTPVMVIMPRGLVDRSPCGTGTTAKVATLYARGDLELDQPFTHRSVTGATYTGRPVADATIGSVRGCRVAITGTAHLVADSTIYLDRADALASGFQLG